MAYLSHNITTRGAASHRNVLTNKLTNYLLFYIFTRSFIHLDREHKVV